MSDSAQQIAAAHEYILSNTCCNTVSDPEMFNKKQKNGICKYTVRLYKQYMYMRLTESKQILK